MKEVISNRNGKENYKHAFLLLFLSFMILQIFYLLTSNESFLFEKLDISAKTLPVECFFLFTTTILLFCLTRYFIKISRYSLIAMIWSLYFSILSITSQTASVTLGALLFQLPALIVMIFWYKNNKIHCSKGTSIVVFVTILSSLFLIIRNVWLFSLQVKQKDITEVFTIKGDLFLFNVNKVLYLGIAFVIILIVAFFVYTNQELFQNKMIIRLVLLSAPILLGSYVLCKLIEIMYFRTLTLCTPTYDMGLFSQMFYSMSEGNGPLTTLERDGLMSHFAVHISPIYYFMLPFYMLWPKPETLQIVQVLIVASGILPFCLIAKELKLPNLFISLSACLYCIAPGLIGSSLYDVHENCFLAPCLLWVIYFILKNNYKAVAICIILVLGIKEDAALYLITIGIYFLIQNRFPIEKRKKIALGILVVAIPCVYFIAAVFYLNKFGVGAMVGRFEDLIAYPELGLLSIPITLFQNFTYGISLMLTPAKVTYILTVLGAIGFLPILQKQFREYILIIPFLVMHLMSNYEYQYNLHFQYHYGTSVLLLFMALLVMKDRQNKKNRGMLLVIILCMGAITFGFIHGASVLKKYEKSYEESYINNDDKKNSIKFIKDSLDQIPLEDSVLASGFLTTYLSQRDELYDAAYHNKRKVDDSIDWVVIDNRWQSEYLQTLKNDYISSGYFISDLSNQYVIILRHRK